MFKLLQLMSYFLHLTWKLTIAVHVSLLNVCFVTSSTSYGTGKMFFHVGRLDKKKTLAGKMMWVVIQWLLLYENMVLHDAI